MLVLKQRRRVLSQGPVKTGQITSYVNYDDAYYQKKNGWWIGFDDTNNRVRFEAKTIAGLLDDDDVVIDRAMNRMWAADAHSVGGNNGGDTSWQNALNYANWVNSTVGFAYYFDWRIPTINEWSTIINHGRYHPAVYTDFWKNVDFATFWSSTTRNSTPTTAWVQDLNEGIKFYDNKGDDNRVLLIRNL